MIFFWPRSVFEEVHLKKDPGAIPLGFTKLGYKVILVVGRMKATHIWDTIEVIELGSRNSDKIEFSTNSIGNGLIKTYRVMKSLIYTIQGAIDSVRIFNKEDPSLIIALHLSLSSLLSIFLYKFTKTIKIRKSGGKNKLNENRFLMKLDVNPDRIKKLYNSKHFIDFLVRFVYFITFLVYDRILVETSCAYNELNKLNFPPRFIKKLNIVPDGYFDEGIKINKNHSRNIILSIGTITYQKGFDILLGSFHKVHQYHTDWQLKIVGPIEDTLYYEQLQKLVTSFKLENSVVFTGGLYGDDLEREFNSASIFCFLSRSESFGIVRAEAIAHGLPVITSEAGCGVEYEKFGSIVVPIENVEKPYEAMLKLIENPGLRDEISMRQIDAVMTFNEIAIKIDNLSRLE